MEEMKTFGWYGNNQKINENSIKDAKAKKLSFYEFDTLIFTLQQ